MRKVISIIFLCSAAAAITSCSYKKDVDYSPFYKDDSGHPVDPVGPGGNEPNTFKAMSFNVRNYASDSGTEHAWTKRKSGVAAMLNTKCPMIVGAQECYVTQMNDITRACPQYGAYGLGRDNGTTSGETTAIFYCKDSVNVVEYGTFWLSATPNKVSLGWDGACRRTCTWMRFKMKSSGQEFFVFNTHLDHQGAVAKVEGMKLIMEKIEAIDFAGLPVILTGDFNSIPGDEVFTYNTLDDARKDSPRSDNFGSSNGYGNQNKQIDHIFYKGIRPLVFETIRDRWEGITYISDHYPIMCTFKYGE